MHTYEVEIKALLGSPSRAEKIRKLMAKLDPTARVTSRNKQLNHYFVGTDLKKLEQNIAPLLAPKARTRLKDIVKKAKDFSVRTRNKDGEILFVIKASVDTTTSANGISRIELEEKVPLTLSQLDKLILKSGFTYQAKWSREREEYICQNTNVCLDKNAGYGYLAEFERVVHSEKDIKKTRQDVRKLMKKLGVEELKQDRLARMFDYYNKNWPKYYGTTKIFTVK
jgi:predicted adenylyl cyclase CyaB